MYLVTTSSTLEGQHPAIGVIVGPRVGGIRPLAEGRRWAGDNDAFHGKFTRERFERHLDRLAPHREGCLFIAAPDVVADPRATAGLFETWGPRVRELGWPVAWVAQDGATPADIPDCDAVFVGGSTGWKLSAASAAIMAEARRRGHWVHVGRVNSLRRAMWCCYHGADSVDGTYLGFRGRDRGLREITGWLEAVRYEKENRLL